MRLLTTVMGCLVLSVSLAAQWPAFLRPDVPRNADGTPNLGAPAPRLRRRTTAVAALQTVGACLVVAMLVTPGATAYLLTDRFGKMIGLATTMGVGTSIVGAYASYFFDGSTGGCIVTLQSMLFVIALVFGRKHGLVAARARRREASLPAAPRPVMESAPS